jgi:anti-sigma-K factor RskA
MHHDELRELAASYALDALSDDERRTFEQHIDVCPECAGEAASLRATVAELAYSVPPRQAPAHLRARVLHAIEAVPAGPRSVAVDAPGSATNPPGTSTNPWWLAAAAIFAAILVGGYALTLRAHIGFLDQELREARAQAASAQQQLRDAQAQLGRAQLEVQRANLTTSILGSPDIVRVDLKGQATAPGAIGRAFWSRSRGVLFTASSLPPLPASKAYQLWILPASGAPPLSAGLLTMDSEGRALVVGDAPTSDPPKGFAVTMEPAGGSATPTMPILLVGTQ